LKKFQLEGPHNVVILNRESIVFALLSGYFLDKNFVFHFYEDNDSCFHSFIIVLYVIKVRTHTNELLIQKEHSTFQALSGSIYVARILDLSNGQFVHKIDRFESFKSIVIDSPISYQKSLYHCFMHYHFDEELYIGEKIEYDANGKIIQITHYNGNGKKEQIYYGKDMILKQNLVNRRFKGQQLCEFNNGNVIHINYDTKTYNFSSSDYSISSFDLDTFSIKTSEGSRHVTFTISDKHWRFLHLQVLVK
jgi:hypothetical protein